MRIFQLIFYLLVILTLASCKKEQQSIDSAFEFFNGRWEWTHSTKNIQGSDLTTIAPSSKYYILEFSADRSIKFYWNDALIKELNCNYMRVSSSALVYCKGKNENLECGQFRILNDSVIYNLFDENVNYEFGNQDLNYFQRIK